jgi:hypothetical protein
VPGSLERKRKTISLGLCLTKTIARQRLREYIEREGVNTKETFTTNTAPVTTFKQQSELARLPCNANPKACEARNDLWMATGSTLMDTSEHRR